MVLNDNVCKTNEFQHRQTNNIFSIHKFSTDIILLNKLLAQENNFIPDIRWNTRWFSLSMFFISIFLNLSYTLTPSTYEFHFWVSQHSRQNTQYKNMAFVYYSCIGIILPSIFPFVLISSREFIHAFRRMKSSKQIFARFSFQFLNFIALLYALFASILLCSVVCVCVLLWVHQTDTTHLNLCAGVKSCVRKKCATTFSTILTKRRDNR